jgi:uncharacterized protein YjiS (DUF1127 family)
MALAGIMLSAVKRMFVAIRNRRQVARLTDLDERTLKDIGLTRSEVMAALDQPLLRDPSMHLEHGAMRWNRCDGADLVRFSQRATRAIWLIGRGAVSKIRAKYARPFGLRWR